MCVLPAIEEAITEEYNGAKYGRLHFSPFTFHGFLRIEGQENGMCPYLIFMAGLFKLRVGDWRIVYEIG